MATRSGPCRARTYDLGIKRRAPQSLVISVRLENGCSHCVSSSETGGRVSGGLCGSGYHPVTTYAGVREPGCDARLWSPGDSSTICWTSTGADSSRGCPASSALGRDWLLPRREGPRWGLRAPSRPRRHGNPQRQMRSRCPLPRFQGLQELLSLAKSSRNGFAMEILGLPSRGHCHSG